MRLERSSLLWSVAFGLLFAACLYVRVSGATEAVRLVLAGFLFGTYCAFCSLPAFAKKPKPAPLLLQVTLGAALGVAFVLLLRGSSDLLVPGAIVGAVLGYLADMWARHVSLP